MAGCSAGALIGGCYLARKLDDLEKWAISLNKRKIVGYFDLHVGRGGLIKGERLVGELRGLIGPLRIEDLRIPYIAIATDLVMGHEIRLQQGDLTEALRASFSLPGCADMVIAVNLNTDIIGKSRRPGTGVPVAMGFDPLPLLEESGEASTTALTDSLTRGIFRRDYDKPSVFGVMTTSLSIMQDRLTCSRLAGDLPDVHITPRVGHIGLLEFDRAEELIREGEDAVERKRPELIDALQVMGFACTV